MSRTKSNDHLSSAWRGRRHRHVHSCRGMTAGAVGTAVHSSVMWLGRSMRRFARPPELIIDSVLSSEHDRAARRGQSALASASHLGFGVGNGCLARDSSSSDGVRRPMRFGCRLRLGLYTASYIGVIPRFGVLPFPHQDNQARQLALVAAHVGMGSEPAGPVRPCRWPDRDDQPAGGSDSQGHKSRSDESDDTGGGGNPRVGSDAMTHSRCPDPGYCPREWLDKAVGAGFVHWDRERLAERRIANRRASICILRDRLPAAVQLPTRRAITRSRNGSTTSSWARST